MLAFLRKFVRSSERAAAAGGANASTRGEGSSSTSSVGEDIGTLGAGTGTGSSSSSSSSSRSSSGAGGRGKLKQAKLEKLEPESGKASMALAGAGAEHDEVEALGLLPSAAVVARFVDVAGFKAHALALAATPSGFLDEFVQSRLAVQSTYAGRFTPSTPAVRQRNRYPDIVTLDDARVRLKTGSGDYINASSVVVEGVRRQYIAAQAPLENTFEDFWRMCWEQRVAVVVMLTPWREGARLKASPYLPLEVGAEERHGAFAVACEALDLEQHDVGIDVRSLKLSHGGVHRLVTHIHFTAWPDFGSVRDFSLYLRLHATVHQYLAAAEAEGEGESEGEGEGECDGQVDGHGQRRPPSPQPPSVNHCSAGIGRTGTYVAIDAAMEWVKAQCARKASPPAKLSIAHLFEQLRNQRPGMVVTPEQYEMLYQVVYYVLLRAPLAGGQDDKDDEDAEAAETMAAKAAKADASGAHAGQASGAQLAAMAGVQDDEIYRRLVAAPAEPKASEGAGATSPSTT